MPAPTIPIDRDSWVDAAPFAAHLAHLCATTGLPWPVVATYAGVSLRAAARLVGGRRGHRLRRLPRPLAQQLLAVTPAQLTGLRRARVPAESSIRRVAHLVGRGVPLPHLARQLGCTTDLVARLADGTPATVTAEVALRARIASETADRRSLCASPVAA